MIYLKEKDIDRIEKENSQIKSEVPGKYLSEKTTRKIQIIKIPCR